MTLTYISCSSDFYTFYVNVPLSLGCIIRKVSAEDIAIRGNGTGLEYMCPTRHFVYIFFNRVFQVSTAKNEINLFNNPVLIVAPVTFAPAGAMTPSAEFLFLRKHVLGVFSHVFSFLFFFPWALKRMRSCTNVDAFSKVRHTSTGFPKRCDRILISVKDIFKTHLREAYIMK